jgi:hypothetical protein
MVFTKLDSNIVQSSIMLEKAEVFKLWIVLLATCESDGISRVSPVFLSSVCHFSIKDTLEYLSVLESPDELSRSLNNEGRRIKRVDGGYEIINYQKYRDFCYSSSSSAVRQRKHRKSVTPCDMSQTSSEDKEEIKQKNIIPPKIEWVTDYCNQRQNNIIPQKFFDYYQTRGWKIKGQPMKDWQAAVRTWEQSGYNNSDIQPQRRQKPEVAL